jgi:hypothetical protein
MTAYCMLMEAQIIEALWYKPEGHGFDSRWYHLDFSLASYFQQKYDPEVDSARNRNENQDYILGGKGGRYVRLTTLLPSCTNCIKIWKPQTPVILENFLPTCLWYSMYFSCGNICLLLTTCLKRRPKHPTLH